MGGKIHRKSIFLALATASLALAGPAFADGSAVDWKNDVASSVYPDWTLGGADLDPTSLIGDASLPEVMATETGEAGDTSATEQPNLTGEDVADSPLVGVDLTAAGALADAASNLVTSDCYFHFDKITATPPPPASGNPFAVATTGSSYTYTQGATQAEVTHRGTSAVSTTTKAKVNYLLSFTWPSDAPGNATVIAHMQPAWRGAIALQSYATSSTSSAQAHFYAGAGFYDRTLSQYLNTQAYANITKSTYGTANKKWLFEHILGANAQDKTFGTSLKPGHRYFFYSYSSSSASVTTDLNAPAAADIDFGSKYLDTPASQAKSDGSSISGFAEPGSVIPGDFAHLVFKANGYRVQCS